MQKKWESYEEVATYLLNQCANKFGLDRVEGKRSIKGQRSNTEYEIDAKGVRENNEGFIIIECRRYTTSRQNQEKIASLAYRIIDTGADGGIIVSPLGIQQGAAKIASAENIINVQLAENSTPREFSLSFLNKIMVGIEFRVVAKMTFVAKMLGTCRTCGNKFHLVANEQDCRDCQNSAHRSSINDR